MNRTVPQLVPDGQPRPLPVNQNEIGSRRRSIPPFKRSRSSLAIAKEFIILVLETSSVHGLNHVVAKKRHPVEKTILTSVLWIFVVLIGAYGAYFFAQSTLRRFNESPTVISLERNYKDWNTTFPSVTICPHEKIDGNLPEEVITKWFGDKENRSEAIEWLDALARASYDNFDRLTIDDRLLPSQYLQVMSETTFKLKYTVSNSNSESGALVTTVTERGICYTFNSMVAMYSSPEYWMSNNRTVDTSFNVFKGNPLEGDIFAQVMDLNSGYTVNIHSPYEIPDVSTAYQISTPNIYMSIDVTALSTVASDEIKTLSTTRRKCRFLEESNLKTSPVYSYNQCRSECRMILAHKLCQCVPYFHRPSERYRICDVKGMKCLGQYKERLITLKKGLENEVCNCLPPCNDVIYSIFSITATPWHLGTNLKFGLLKYPRSRLKRDLFFTRSDLLVQLGGSASLCLGFSVLSFFEFIYLFTLRLALFLCDKFRNS